MQVTFQAIIKRINGNLLGSRTTKTFPMQDMASGNYQLSMAITSIVSTTTTATATTAQPHGLETGDYTIIRNAETPNHNKPAGVQVTVVSSTIFTYTITSTAATSTKGQLWEFYLNEWQEGTALTYYGVVGLIATTTAGLPIAEWATLHTYNGTQSIASETLYFAKNMSAVTAVTNDTAAVTSITRSTTTATATTTAAHNLITGDYVVISGAVETEYNGTVQVTVLTSTTFTYTVAGSPATPATGTILFAKTYTTFLLHRYNVSMGTVNVQESLAVVNAAILYTETGEFLTTGATAQTKSGLLTLTAGATFGAPNTYSSATAITAHAGGGQGSAVALAAEFNEITVCATDGDSVKLPAAAAGGYIGVKNNGVGAADIYPATGDSINALAVNTAVRIATGATIYFRAVDGTVWEASNQVIAGENGTAVAPTFTFSSDPDTGFYRVASNSIGVTIDEANVGTWDANGYQGIIGGTTPANGFFTSAQATQFKLSALNTAPANASATGVLGEIRIDTGFIYVCTATNTWKRIAISTW